MNHQVILVTGGAGFIGTNFVNETCAGGRDRVINLDKLTYAGNAHNFAPNLADHVLIIGDIADRSLVDSLLAEHMPRAVVNFAAESHVDRSIHAPADFIQTNVVGTVNLLEAARDYWAKLPKEDQSSFRFLHVSTDEVFGTLSSQSPAFSEATPYAPNSPYAASKAASDHLVRAWHHTYGLPTVTVNSSNNYGPYQYPEKLIPLMLHHAIAGKSLPLYGDGLQIRDWIFVADFCDAIRRVLDRGRVGESYNIGARSEKTNREVVEILCMELDRAHPRRDGRLYREQISFVADRPGHDRRYAIDCSKIESELGWHAKESFDAGLRKTVRWYLDHPDWVASVTGVRYQHWIDKNYQRK